MPLTPSSIRTILKLPADANTAASFDDLGVDSWGLIELRAVIETKFSVTVTDEEWIEITCPDDVVRLATGRAA